MAKNYRTTKQVDAKDMGTISDEKLICTIKPTDSQQSLGSYLANVKVSCMVNNLLAGPTAPAFTVYATTDDDSFASATIITAGATPCGGGTVNLSLKRRIRDSEEDPSRSDGPVYIWARCSQNIVSQGADETYAAITVEAWGRFLEVQLA